jgi:hypothetical protein
MSMMGELTFFLGIEVKQIKEDTFVHQGKYMNDLIKKFTMTDAKPVSTPMSTMTALDPDEDGETVNQRECTLLGFPTHFTSSSNSANLQVSQTNS